MTESVAAPVDLETEEEFRGVVREFVEQVAPISATRRYVEGDREYDLDAWRRAAGEIQIVEVGVPESAGGQGAGLAVTAVLFEEFGRSLAPGPLLGTVGLAAQVLARIGTPDAVEELAALFAGTRTATVGWVGAAASWDPSATPIRVTGDGRDVRVSGTLHHVIDGDVADTLFLVARREGRDSLMLVAVETGAAGLDARRLDALDLTRRLARVELAGASGRVIGGDDESAAIASGLLAATALLSAESAGAARRALELTVEYARIRHQFGRPIGSFQAIKHKCADMLSRVELMSALATDAVRQVEAAAPEAAKTVHAAKAYASEAFFDVASETVHVHGGIGFTWEHDAHLFFRRAKSSEYLLGGPVEHRAAIAADEGWLL